ncbi:winged helix-turn-helix domain-containing protein [Bordetella sp. 02P26C-1]|uniref:winged helix-turn-helix domain-containing protein n=1 Tax=Bordetella sp. 02P26C-1 TaxID=2683195 RepID=UPI001354DD4E|nr:winged helix-turn-helix domain-containing protein [Bordetella sp. 02P26C-1]MVW78009.1 DNA-binding response regulator [Bordetella sp. 02P26C-1]
MNTSPDVLFLTGDDPAVSQITELTHLGFKVHHYGELAQLYEHLSQHAVPLVVLTGGLSLIDIAAAQLRVMLPAVGIVAIADFPDSDSRVRTLLSGADACLDATTSGLELAAVLQSLMRRIAEAAQHAAAVEPAPQTYVPTPTPTHAAHSYSVPLETASSTGKWRLTSKGWALMAPTGQMLSLTTAERSLLLRFAHEPDKRISRDALSADLASGEGPESERRGRFIDVMISRMRRKAAAQRVRLPIKAVHGWGYMFTSDLLVDADIPDLEDVTASR